MFYKALFGETLHEWWRLRHFQPCLIYWTHHPSHVTSISTYFVLLSPWTWYCTLTKILVIVVLLAINSMILLHRYTHGLNSFFRIQRELEFNSHISVYLTQFLLEMVMVINFMMICSPYSKGHYLKLIYKIPYRPKI